MPARAASSAHRSRSASGVRFGSLRSRVANEARSSAFIRSLAVTASGPASRTVSMATVRLENARSWARSKPTISRQPLRSGPHVTPRLLGELALQLGLEHRARRP